MGVFDYLRSKSQQTSVVWRNSKGEIECPGDNCPQKDCDDTCPIWRNTMAITMMNIGQLDKALEELQEAVKLAPTFKDAWANMGGIYGSMNNHLEANKAFKAAYVIDHKYKNALIGLIVSSRNLGQFDEALRYCDQMASIYGESEVKEFRDKVLEQQSAGNTPRRESATSMAMTIVAEARERGILGANENFPNIPEIMAGGREACMKVFKDLIDCGDEDGRKPNIWFAWAAYTGMGAVYHWHVDWDALKKKGIAETMLEPRGNFALDEYVVDTIGIGYESEEGQEFAKQIYYLSMWVFGEFLPEKPDQNSIKTAFEIMYAMYLFGMVFEMERLGMR